MLLMAKEAHMSSRIATIPAATLLLISVGAAGLAAGQSQERAPMAARELLEIEGQLFKFDSDQRLIWIKAEQGREMEFNYGADTPLVGATKPLQPGDTLKVFYEVEGEVNRAMRVEFIGDAAPQPE
jgi:hypothetical protein